MGGSSLKQWLARSRVLMALFVAVLLPLGSGRCALMPWSASTAAVVTQPHDAHGAEHAGVHHEADDRDCCPESGPSHAPSSDSDPLCCGSVQVPTATTPAPVSLSAPASDPMAFAVVAMGSTAHDPRGGFLLLVGPARSGSPPDPSTASPSPRGPPHSA